MPAQSVWDWVSFTWLAPRALPDQPLPTSTSFHRLSWSRANLLLLQLEIMHWSALADRCFSFLPSLCNSHSFKISKTAKKRTFLKKKKKLLKNHTVYFSCSLPFTVYIAFLCWCKECLVKCSFKSIIIHLFWKRNPLQKYTRNRTKSAYLWKRGLYNYIISVISQYLFPLSFSNSDKCST